MSFFGKKKRLTEEEGYERMTRLWEDGSRTLAEGGDGGGALDLDEGEDTVVLTAPPRVSRESPPEPLMSAAEPAPAAAERLVPVAPSLPITPAAPAPTPPVSASAPAIAPAIPRMPPPPDLTHAGSGMTLVAKDAVWEGKLTCTADVRVEGVVEGEIETAGTLYVTAAARVHGQVRARNAVLAGELDGQLRCEQRLEILPGGSARGEIDTGTLIVHEGAFIESRFQMRAPAATRA